MKKIIIKFIKKIIKTKNKKKKPGENIYRAGSTLLLPSGSD